MANLKFRDVEQLNNLATMNLQLAVAYMDDCINGLHECVERLEKSLRLKDELCDTQHIS